MSAEEPLLYLRAAEERDQQKIRKLVRGAHLNPLGLEWPHFRVVEDARRGAIAGIGQIRPHGKHTQELASIVVDPAYQKRGIGGLIVRTLLARTTGPLYLFCRAEMAPYYVRFGFVPATAQELPPRLAWRLRIGTALTGLISRFRRVPLRVLAMRRVP